MTHTAPFSSTPFTPLPTFRNIPPITTLVPPDIGPDFGNTEEMDGLTYVYWRLDCAVAMVLDLLIVIITFCIPSEVYVPVTHSICIPGLYPSDCTIQDTPPTVTLTMSPTVTPRLVPVMVSIVPPPNGPEVGETDLNTGEGHWFGWMANVDEQVSGATQLIPLHHPQSYPVPMLTARQEVHTGAENAEQSYSVTEDEGEMLRSEVNTHMFSPWMTPRGSIGYITVLLLVQIRLILATIAVVPTGREIWGERVAILIEEMTSPYYSPELQYTYT